MIDLSAILSVFLIALGLSADCFAVALGAGLSGRGYNARQVWRVAGSFGLFQAVMPVLGWLAGETIVNYIAAYDHWVAFGLLSLVAGHMLWESLRPGHEEAERTDVSGGMSLLVLSIATSIDALAVGLTLSFLNISIILAGPTIGAMACLITALGFALGRKAGARLGRWAEISGALILLAIGVRIVLSHIR
jgi:putative Mn2+ efflux pump MntP